MKKMFTIIFAFFVVQCAFAQKMQIHTSTMGTIEVQLSNVDSITFTVAGGLQVNPNNMYVPQGGSMQATINGGKTPYSIQVAPNSSIATASIAGNSLTVNGVTLGSTSLVVKDNSIPVQTVMVNIFVTTGPGGLTADPNYLRLAVAEQKTSTISGGTTPYSILTPPNAGVASASISGSVVTVTGVGGGDAFIVVKDNSSPYKTATINVGVYQIFTSSGSLSFTSDVGNFSATGIFDNASDSMPTNTQGAGGFFSHDLGPFAALEVVGYVKNSSTNWDIAVVVCVDSANIAAGTYSFLANGPGPIRRAEFMYVKGWNPSDTTGNNPFDSGSYMLVTGSASLSSYTGTSAQGTFSGTGQWFAQDIPDPTKPITLTNGTFTVPVISGSILKSSDQKAIEKLLHRLNR
jgi:hypothetical protein